MQTFIRHFLQMNVLATRKAVVVATACSAICVLSVAVLLPMMHFRSQELISSMLSQVELCKVCDINSTANTAFIQLINWTVR